PPSRPSSRHNHPSPPSRDSSPIGELLEERQILTDFWNWKLKGHTDPDERQLLLNARATMNAQMWRLDDYKELSIPTTDTHKQALRLGVPHGLIKAMSRDLHNFKTIYRTVYRPGRELLNLRGHAAVGAGEAGQYGGEYNDNEGGFVQ
ncbi:MAG: hypothetical protein M1812_005857, partial [Candelaria pacifica]